MDVKDSSEDDDVENASTFGKYDESIEVCNAEEVRSPTNRLSDRFLSERFSRKGQDTRIVGTTQRVSSHDKIETKRFIRDNSEQALRTSSDPSDSEGSNDDEIQVTNTTESIETYDPEVFKNLIVTPEVKELFQNIFRYTPQKIELNYKLIPFIPEYIPAVGDIDAFIKVSRPDGVQGNVGLDVLDEPCTNQSDPAVLYLQLRNYMKSAGAAKQTVIKRIESAEKNGKHIEKWINDINQLHRTKHLPAVQLNKSMPDIDLLMQQWPVELEEKLNETQIDFFTLDCELPRLVDIVCCLLDIPIYTDSRLQSLHILFTFFVEIKNIMSQNF